MLYFGWDLLQMCKPHLHEPINNWVMLIYIVCVQFFIQA